MKITNLFFKFTILFLLGTVQFASAQTTISNTPSTDVIEPKNFYLEVNYGGHFGKYADGGFQTYGLKAVYGLSRNIEVGTNMSFTKDGGTSPVEITPNVKWKAYYNEKNKVTVSGGAMLFVPVKNEKGSRPMGFVYANVSKGFDFAKGFRLTSGVYHLVGAKSESGNRKGVMLGYEQNLAKRVSFYADWTSGKNRFGYAAAGLSIAATKKDVIYTGYNFGNSGRGNNWFTISYGHYF